MIRACADDLIGKMKTGMVVCLVVGTERDAAEYIAYFRMRRASGKFLILVADRDNGTAWKTRRFDSIAMDPSAKHRPRGEELLQEAVARLSTGKPTSMNILDRNGRPMPPSRPC
jgi:hypothetical protein